VSDLDTAMTRVRQLCEASLDRLCAAFDLSPFARDILLLCAGVELDGEVATLCQGGPTFGLALATLPDAHWTALLPSAPLRYWRLIRVVPGDTLLTSALRIEEPVLHALMGIVSPDERLAPMLEDIAPPDALPASYRTHVERLIALWTRPDTEAPIVHLRGSARTGKRTLAAAACSAIGWRLRSLRSTAIPATAAERIELARLWDRDAIIGRSALLVDMDGARAVAAQMRTPVIVVGDGLIEPGAREVVEIAIDRPPAAEQRALWEHALGAQAMSLNGELDRLAAAFTLDTDRIEATGRSVLEGPAETLAPRLWEACRSEARPALESLAQRVIARATWRDVVLPDASLDALRALVVQARHHARVVGEWGFARSARGTGISALFHGASGTGKTLAAEVLANELHLDLYRVDLSQVVSKYVGETEKNLRSVFDAAEQSGALLLFDEADALFGRRSEVRDSHDRYANIEVSYLLQRMEAYPGLAILTTNMRSGIDAAFQRRLRFIIDFPFPGPALRRRIWEAVFPAETPTDGLDYDRLARLNLPGGNIRNIALGAAFLAADDGSPVRMHHLLASARREYAKIERPLSAAEVGGWT